MVLNSDSSFNPTTIFDCLQTQAAESAIISEKKHTKYPAEIYANITVWVYRDKMISPLLVCTPPPISLCLFDSLKCHLNTEYSLSLFLLLSFSSQVFVSLCSPSFSKHGKQNRAAAPQLKYACVAAEWLINISLSDTVQPNPSSQPICLPCDYNLKLVCESHRGRSFLMVVLYTD